VHEPAAVQALLQPLITGLAQSGATRVSRVRLQQGGAFPETTLRDASQWLSVGTVLEGADLEVEIAEPTLACGCGFRLGVTGDDLKQDADACPRCGAVLEVEDGHRLELVEAVCHDRAGLSRPGRPPGLGGAPPADWRV
jgi:Zn finger protein HypA/HybF involved in hydrogenase expression